MRINFPQFKPTFAIAKKQNNSAKFQNVPMKADTFSRSEVVFKGNNYPTSSFKIKTLKNLHCPVCGYIMLNSEQQMEFVKDVYDKKGEDLASALEKYEDESVFTHKQNEEKKGIFNPHYQQIVNIIKDLARRNPTLELSQIIKLQANSCISSLIKRQLAIVDELNEYIEKNISDPEQKELIKKAVQEQEKRMKGNSLIGFSRKVFIYEIVKATNNEKDKEAIHKIASKLPNSTNDTDSFFVKYSKDDKTSKEIALKLVEQSRPTAEHLFPESKGGASSLSNYLCDCANCNQKKDDMDFYDWQKDIPDFQQRLQEHLQIIQNALDNRELPDSYDSYIPNIIDTIYKLSRHQIKLHQPDSTLDETIAKTINKRHKSIKTYQEKLSRIIQEKVSTENTIKKAKRSQSYKTIISGQKTHQELKNALDIKIAQLRALLKQNQTILDEKKEISKKTQIISDIGELKAQIGQLSNRNSQLEQFNLANADDIEEYKAYLYTKQLRDEALQKRDQILLKGDLRKSRTDIEILNYALRGLQEKLSSYETSKTIEYFNNIEEIAICNERIKELQRKLQKIREQEQRTIRHRIELKSQLKGKTISEIEHEYKSAPKEEEILDIIQKLPELQEKLEHLESVIQHNAKILKKAQHVYKTASNKDFDELMSELNL